MTANKAPKIDKLPKAVQDLRRRGERIRFPGFWLYDTPRDRIIAHWLDYVQNKDGKTPLEQQVNVSELVKDFLYQVATGQTTNKTAQAVIGVLGPKLDALGRKLASGVVMTNTNDQAEMNDADEIYNALAAMDD